MTTLPPATPCIGFEYAVSFIECCWACQARIVAFKELPVVPEGSRGLGLCSSCEEGLLP